MATRNQQRPATKAETNGKAAAKTAKAARDKKVAAVTTLLKQMSDQTRYTIMLLLAENGEMHVGGLCAELNQSQPAVSHHLALLRHGGLIAPRREGKNNFYSLTDRVIGGVSLADFVTNTIAE